MEVQNKPVLYSKTSLIVLSLFSCFFSGLLFVQNLREVKKKKFVLPMILYAIFFPTILSNMFKSIGIPVHYSYIPINLMGGVLLTNVFWKYQIEIDDYKNRSLKVPIIVIVSIVVVLILMNIFILPNRH